MGETRPGTGEAAQATPAGGSLQPRRSLKDEASHDVSIGRSCFRKLGTALSRFRIAAQVASSVADVTMAAEARITDADVAENSAALVRNQILQQAASAILAQANQQPALALTLLRE